MFYTLVLLYFLIKSLFTTVFRYKQFILNWTH